MHLQYYDLNRYIITVSTLVLILLAPYFVAQNTIRVKKESKLCGQFIGKYNTKKKPLITIGNKGIFKWNKELIYLCFSKNGVATIGFYHKKSKKYLSNLIECAENGKFCDGIKIYNYRLNEDFADKGLSPYRHIEFFEVANTLSSTDVPPSSQSFKFSKVEAELEGKLLHLRYRGKDSEQNKYYILTQQ